MGSFSCALRNEVASIRPESCKHVSGVAVGVCDGFGVFVAVGEGVRVGVIEEVCVKVMVAVIVGGTFVGLLAWAGTHAALTTSSTNESSKLLSNLFQTHMRELGIIVRGLYYRF